MLSATRPLELFLLILLLLIAGKFDYGTFDNLEGTFHHHPSYDAYGVLLEQEECLNLTVVFLNDRIPP